MVTSERLANVEPWLHRQGFNVDSWLLHDAFSHDSDLLAKALHNTVSAPPHTLPPLFSFTLPQLTPFPLTYTVDLISNQEVVGGGGAKRKRNCILTGSEGKSHEASLSRFQETSDHVHYELSWFIYVEYFNRFDFKTILAGNSSTLSRVRV
ncbi:hypothetical protein Bca101_080562 [Brassica carinata]